MNIRDKTIVIDLDGTLCEIKRSKQEYADVKPRKEVVEKLREYRKHGFYVIIMTSRGMRTFGDNVKQVEAHMLKTIIGWLERHKIPYDEVCLGKPWRGNEGFYVDDRAIRPDEFTQLSKEEIDKLIGRE